MKFKIYLFLCVSTLCVCEEIRLRIADGELEGDVALSYEERKYYRFQSIPFAEPPIEDLRFRLPRPVTPWNGTLVTTSPPPPCLMYGQGFHEGQEDCLYLNVFTPVLPSETDSSRLPVLVWLHGGAFIAGCSNDYSPSLLMDRNIVLVIPQYRLGIMGFLESSPTNLANAGLRDQVFALEWVKKNIDKFGGDPGRVTLGGDDAGAASAILHMMIPESEGLFHGVAAFSGTPLNPWALQTGENLMVDIIKKNFKCKDAKCLRTVPVMRLMEYQNLFIMKSDYLVGNGGFGPLFENKPERKFKGKGPVIPIHPLERLVTKNLTSDVPVLMSLPRDVGAYLVHMLIARVSQMPRPEYGYLMSNILREVGLRDTPNVEEIKDFYVPEWKKRNFNDILDDLAGFLTDAEYTAGILETAKLLSQIVPTRVLRFDYTGGPKIFDLRFPFEEDAPKMKPGVSMGDDMFAFLPYDDTHVFTPDQEKVKDEMLDVIENFVYQRESTKTWPLFDPEYMKTNTLTKSGDLAKGIKFCANDEEYMLSMIFKSQYKDVLDRVLLQQEDGENYASLHMEL